MSQGMYTCEHVCMHILQHVCAWERVQCAGHLNACECESVQAQVWELQVYQGVHVSSPRLAGLRGWSYRSVLCPAPPASQVPRAAPLLSPLAA